MDDHSASFLSIMVFARFLSSCSASLSSDIFLFGINSMPLTLVSALNSMDFAEITFSKRGGINFFSSDKINY